MSAATKLPDRARWQRLGPLLDELLELDAVGQALRMSLLQATDTTLTEELWTLLQAARDADATDFLAGHALDRTPWLRQ
jgi:hypothetical protein